MSHIHPTAIIHPSAQLHPTVQVGAYSVIHADVKIGEGTKIGEHCVIDGDTTIGKNNVFYRFCSIGGQPQDKKYAGEKTKLEIGDGNTFREYVTVSTGTVQDVGVTRIANDCWIMAYVHIAHDCQLGSHVVIANGVQFAGHVHIGDWAIIGGLSAAHQFTRIGAHAMVGGMSAMRQDVPPYVLGAGQPFKSAGINSEGLRRRGFSPEQITLVKEGYKFIYMRALSIEEAVQEIAELQKRQTSPELAKVLQPYLDFFHDTSRGIARG